MYIRELISAAYQHFVFFAANINIELPSKQLYTSIRFTIDIKSQNLKISQYFDHLVPYTKYL